jgi:hypothetical protein
VRVVDAAGNVVDDGPESTAVVRLAVNRDGAHPKATLLTDLNNNQQSLYIDRTAVAGVATFGGGSDAGVTIASLRRRSRSSRRRSPGRAST